MSRHPLCAYSILIAGRVLLQWPELPQSQQATSLDRARAAISVLGTQNVSSMLAARAAAAQSQRFAGVTCPFVCCPSHRHVFVITRPGYRSAANVNMDAGVMFGKGPHSSATPLVLAMHAPRVSLCVKPSMIHEPSLMCVYRDYQQQQQQAATASHGRRAMDEAREFEGGDDGWEEYGDTGYRQARPAPTQSVRSDRHPELQQQGQSPAKIPLKCSIIVPNDNLPCRVSAV